MPRKQRPKTPKPPAALPSPADPQQEQAFIKPTGRPPELTQALQALVCNAIRGGAYVETAAALAGVNKKTLYEWLKTAKRPNAPREYTDFRNAVNQALAQGEMRDVMGVDQAVQGVPDKTHPEVGPDGKTRTVVDTWKILPNWKAAAWRLERKFAKRWGRRDQVKVLDGEETDEEAREFESGGSSHAQIMDLLDEVEKTGKKK